MFVYSIPWIILKIFQMEKICYSWDGKENLNLFEFLLLKGFGVFQVERTFDWTNSAYTSLHLLYKSRQFDQAIQILKL